MAILTRRIAPNPRDNLMPCLRSVCALIALEGGQGASLGGWSTLARRWISSGRGGHSDATRSGGAKAATPVAGFSEGVVVPEGRLELPTPRL